MANSSADAPETTPTVAGIAALARDAISARHEAVNSMETGKEWLAAQQRWADAEAAESKAVDAWNQARRAQSEQVGSDAPPGP